MKNISGYNITEDTYEAWECQLDIFKDSEFRKSIMKRNTKTKSTFSRTAINFLSEISSSWNLKTGMVTRVLIPEASLEDEISNKGYMKALLELLVLTSIMSKMHFQNENRSVIKKWKLAKGCIKKKFVCAWTGYL